MRLSKGTNLLLISPESWRQNFVSKHHYAVTLAKQKNIVYFLNPPSLSYSIQPTQYENLYVVDYPPFFKGLRYLPNVVQQKIILQKYEKLQQLVRSNFDIVWSFDNSVFYDFNALPTSVLKISHIVDLNQDFQIAKAANTADICFCTTDHIQQNLKKYNKNTFKIHHGYSLPDDLKQQKIDLPGSSFIKAVYVGNLGLKYIDWKLLQTVVKQHSEVDFIFIGPEENSNLHKGKEAELESSLVKNCPNTYFIGSVPSSEISAYLQSADVLLITYQADLHKEQLASPHKFMDYFGSGKVIVATYTDEYKDKRELLVMSEKNEDYPALLADVFSNLKKYNYQKEQEKRKHFALNNTYEEQIKKIEYYIEEIYTVETC